MGLVVALRVVGLGHLLAAKMIKNITIPGVADTGTAGLSLACRSDSHSIGCGVAGHRLSLRRGPLYIGGVMHDVMLSENSVRGLRGHSSAVAGDT